MRRYPAPEIDGAYQACLPDEPLRPDDPRHVDLTPVRGGSSLVNRIFRRIRRSEAPAFHKQLVTGHRGCGKSTDLLHLQAKLREEGFFAVYLDLEDFLDPNDVEYLDVLLAVARAVQAALEGRGIDVGEHLLRLLEDWFADVVETEEKYRTVEGGLQVELGVAAPQGKVVRFLAALTGSLKSGGRNGDRYGGRWSRS